MLLDKPRCRPDLNPYPDVESCKKFAQYAGLRVFSCVNGQYPNGSKILQDCRRLCGDAGKDFNDSYYFLALATTTKNKKRFNCVSIGLANLSKFEPELWAVYDPLYGCFTIKSCENMQRVIAKLLTCGTFHDYRLPDFRTSRYVLLNVGLHTAR